MSANNIARAKIRVFCLQVSPQLATIHEEITPRLANGQANGSPNGSLNGSPNESPKLMNGSPNGSPKTANGLHKVDPSNYEEISFSTPNPTAYPAHAMFGSDIPKSVLPPLTPIKISEGRDSDWEEPPVADELMVSMSSDTSGDSILLTDRSGLITVGDFISESEACQN